MEGEANRVREAEDTHQQHTIHVQRGHTHSRSNHRLSGNRNPTPGHEQFSRGRGVKARGVNVSGLRLQRYAQCYTVRTHTSPFCTVVREDSGQPGKQVLRCLCPHCLVPFYPKPTILILDSHPNPLPDPLQGQSVNYSTSANTTLLPLITLECQSYTLSLMYHYAFLIAKIVAKIHQRYTFRSDNLLKSQLIYYYLK